MDNDREQALAEGTIASYERVGTTRGVSFPAERATFKADREMRSAYLRNKAGALREQTRIFETLEQTLKQLAEILPKISIALETWSNPQSSTSAERGTKSSMFAEMGFCGCMAFTTMILAIAGALLFLGFLAAIARS